MSEPVASGPVRPPQPGGQRQRPAARPSGCRLCPRFAGRAVPAAPGCACGVHQPTRACGARREEATRVRDSSRASGVATSRRPKTPRPLPAWTRTRRHARSRTSDGRIVRPSTAQTVGVAIPIRAYQPPRPLLLSRSASALPGHRSRIGGGFAGAVRAVFWLQRTKWPVFSRFPSGSPDRVILGWSAGYAGQVCLDQSA